MTQKKKKKKRTKKVEFDTGATRSGDSEHVRFDLISPVGLERLARRYALGAELHGDRNWEGGMPVSDLLNHVMYHQNLYLAGDKSDDHLGAMAWGLFAIMHFEELSPENVDIPTRK